MMQVLMLNNLQHIAARITMCTLVVQILLSISLIYFWGLMGAAVSGSLAIAIWAFLLRVAIRKYIPMLHATDSAR
jgi:O-antigen/teichoic acid export membrane protein